MKNIVILGAGFGGLKTALKLEGDLKKLHDPEWSVILVDKNSYHTYTAALYEAASAYRWKGAADIQTFEELLAGFVCLPLGQTIAKKNITFVRGTVAGVDFWNNTVVLVDEEPIPFDYLIFALGSETIYFGIKGAEKCCYALKNLYDAFHVRRRIEEIFSHANRGKTIQIVIVGGGATGVETIAEIATYTKHLAKDYGLDYANVRISLFEAQSEILAGSPKSLRDAVLRRLKKIGVDILTSTRVEEVMPECILFEGGEKCDADLILWGGGVKGPLVLGDIKGVELDKRGRIAVDEFLQPKGLRKVFAVGDNALFMDEKSAIPAPATAFIAEQQADIAAKNVIYAITGQPLKKYNVSIPGYVISCGGKYAVAHIFGITFSGFLGWLVKKLIDLKYFSSILPFRTALFLWLRELRLFTKND